MVRPDLLARALVAAVAALGLAGSACRGTRSDRAPSCRDVATRFLDIARYDLGRAGVDETARRAVEDQLPALRGALTQACADGGWSAAARTCLVAARDHVSFETCEQQLTDEQRRDLDRVNRGAAGSAL
ncbi:MAG TPA: hypothetical protein VHW23_29865 [Kofleriaceae bacterium]|jgi:hypothetical protein|nr:hypothetical protein [Kofleriaceae bacterium]